MKKFKFFTMALAAMSMVACSNEDEMGRNNPGVGTKGTGIEVQFDVDGTAAGTKSNFEGLVGAMIKMPTVLLIIHGKPEISCVSLSLTMPKLLMVTSPSMKVLST